MIAGVQLEGVLKVDDPRADAAAAQKPGVPGCLAAQIAAPPAGAALVPDLDDNLEA